MIDGQYPNSNADVVTQLAQIAQQMGRWVQTFQGRALFGNFTMTATATLAVPNTGVAGNSLVQLVPTNAPAATLMSSAKALYVTVTPGTGFTVATADGTNAAGTETFQYMINTPL